MTPLHSSLTREKWQLLSQRDQILNIAAEFSRIRNLAQTHQTKAVKECYERALELIDLLKSDPRWKHGLKEICRFREVMSELYANDAENIKESTALERVLIYWNGAAAAAIG